MWSVDNDSADECTIDQKLADAAAYAPGGRRFVFTRRAAALLREMTSWRPSWNYDVKSKIGFCQLMRIYLKNNPDKFHPDPIWNDGALDFLKRSRQNKKKNKMG